MKKSMKVLWLYTHTHTHTCNLTKNGGVEYDTSK